MNIFKNNYVYLNHYLYLIPAFFVIHIGFQYTNTIEYSDLALLTSIYVFVSLIVTSIVYLLQKTFWKAALFTFLLQLIFFFFGDLHIFIKTNSSIPLFSQYKFLLTLIILIIISSYLFILRLKEKPARFVLFINSLFFLFIISDVVNHFLLQKRNAIILAERQFKNDNIELVHKPNIYLLVFDEYASSSSLHQRFNYKNGLDSFLIKNDFYVVSKSRSNYNFTPFSVASLLNLSYLKGLKENDITQKDYQNILALIKKNKLVSILENNGYYIINRSVFNLENAAAFTRSAFLPEGLQILRNQTFFLYAFEDIGWNLLSFGNQFPVFFRHSLQMSKQQNENILEELIRKDDSSKKKPYFLYAHLNMPHPPFFYDSLKRERPIDSIVNETRNHIYKPATYLSYLKYTNGIIENLVTDIQNKEKNNAIIVIIGDHGFRSNITKKEHLFANMNAIYIPDDIRKNPPTDSLSLVNEFRYVLNIISRKEMNLLPDSSFMLTDHNSEIMIKND